MFISGFIYLIIICAVAFLFYLPTFLKDNKRFRKDKYLSNLVFTTMLFAMFIFLYPFLVLVINSFKPGLSSDEAVITIANNPLEFPKPWDLQYIKTYMEKTNFFASFLLSTFITAASVFLITITSSLVAWIFVRINNKETTILFYILLFGMLVPFQAVMFPLSKLMRSLSLDNPFGLIIMYIGFGLPFTVFLYHGFLKGVPKDLEEAATIDGASIFQTFTQVVLPLVKPITVTTMILNAKWIFNDYLLPLLMLGTGEEVTTLPLALKKASDVAGGQFGTGWDTIFPGVFLNVLPIAILFIIFQKHIVAGLTEGAIK